MISNFFSFYMANYVSYYTGVLSTNTGGFGVTELQFLVMGLGIMGGMLGKEFWDYPVLKI